MVCSGEKKRIGKRRGEERVGKKRRAGTRAAGTEDPAPTGCWEGNVLSKFLRASPGKSTPHRGNTGAQALRQTHAQLKEPPPHRPVYQDRRSADGVAEIPGGRWQWGKSSVRCNLISNAQIGACTPHREF